ncbi:hypothetical protein Sjap_005498 [Stephania japonica]|uniref:Uncharacterized protein n=1 Tax=Stephania japonica TaxID=461633 RepID=A0AAP0K5A0_9MAGN
MGMCLILCQLPLHINMSSTQESLALMAVDNSVPSLGGNAHNDNLHKVESFARQSQKLQDDLERLGLKIKHYEENLKFLKNQENMLDEYILDVQGIRSHFRSQLHGFL